VIKIGAQFRLMEPLPTYLFAGSRAPVVCPANKELTLRGFEVRLEKAGRIYELSITDAATDHGFRSRDLAFARRVVPLVPSMALEQIIVLPNAGDAVGISWRLVGEKITPVRLTATPIFSSADPISSEIFVFDADQDGGRLTWLPLRRAGRIIADTNGHCTEPSVTIDSDGWQNIAAPSSFVFELGRFPALLLLSAELPASGATDPLIGTFLAEVANFRGENRNLWAAA
jgi:hypothetical protein